MISDNLFGLVIPGRPVITQFELISPSKASLFIPDPLSVTEIAFFLQRHDILPQGHGIMLYFTHNDQDWELLGAISNDKPSGIFRTGWTTHEIIRTTNPSMIKLGVSIESLDTISNLNLVNSGIEDRFAFAHKIALDLFQYMTSFATNTSNTSLLTVPANIFDRWMERFERKYKQDPNFMMKNN